MMSHDGPGGGGGGGGCWAAIGRYLTASGCKLTRQLGAQTMRRPIHHNGVGATFAWGVASATSCSPPLPEAPSPPEARKPSPPPHFWSLWFYYWISLKLGFFVHWVGHFSPFRINFNSNSTHTYSGLRLG